jgi:hypothetical protein
MNTQERERRKANAVVNALLKDERFEGKLAVDFSIVEALRQ